MFVECNTSKAAMGLDSDSERILSCTCTSMSCGTRLTAVAVGLSIVALDDEEMKTPASMAKNAIAVSYQRLYLYRSDNAYIDRRKSRHI